MKKVLLTISVLGLATAQVLAQFSNNGLIYIAQDAVVSIDMEATNNGIITNQGDLKIKNNFSNNSDFISSGMVTLKSDAGLTLSGDKAIVADNLNLESDVVLRTPLTINKMMNFNNGLVFVEGNSALEFGDNANHNFSGDFSHVVGKVRKTGNGNFTFPIGDGYNIHNFMIKDLSGRTVEANYIAQSPLDVSSEIDFDVENININEYWTIQSNNSSKLEVTIPNNDVVSLSKGVWVNSNNGLNVSQSGSAFTSGSAKHLIKEIGVWPNPTSGEFNLKLSGMRDSDDITVDITNQDGRVIQSMKGKVAELRKLYKLPTNLVTTNLKVRVVNGDEVLTQSLIFNR